MCRRQFADVTRPVELVPECICRNTTLLAKINEDGSIMYSPGPNKPEQKGNSDQDCPRQGSFPIFRFYSPSEPFVDKSWVLNDIEEANDVRVPRRIARWLFMARSGQIYAAL